VDRIALLNLLLQGRREHARPLWIAYVDLRAAFDSVDRTALGLLLQNIGIPSKLIDMFKDLYTNKRISTTTPTVCAWTVHFLTGSSLAVESGKVALLHLLCSSSQLTGFFIVQTT